MLQFSIGVKIIDKIRNVYIRGTAQMGRFGEKTRGKTEVVWACTEERCWVYWEKDVEGTASKEETGKT